MKHWQAGNMPPQNVHEDAECTRSMIYAKHMSEYQIPCSSNTSDHKDRPGSGLAGGVLAVSGGILMSTSRTGPSRLARREDLAAPEAGDPLVDALLACATICFHVAMAAYRTDVNGELANSPGRF